MYMRRRKNMSSRMKACELCFLLLAVRVEIVLSGWTEIQDSRFPKTDDYPTVNKCCPLYMSYENGNCIKAEKNEGMSGNEDNSFWEAPKTMVAVGRDMETISTTQVPADPVVFRLKVSKPNCTSERMEKIIHKDLLTVKQTENDTSGDVEQTVALSTDGFLLWADESGYLNQISYEHFCIDQSSSSFIAVLCRPSCDEKQPCVRKCCQENSVIVNSTCMPSSTSWRPHFYKKPFEELSDYPNATTHFKIGIPHCESMYEILARDDPSERMFLLHNGTLVIYSGGKPTFFEADRFCLDGFGYVQTDGTSAQSDSLYPDTYELAHYSGFESDQVAILCYPDDPDHSEPETWRLRLYASVALVSAFFLMLTSLVYLILWEYQNIHGWLQFSYVISLFFAFTCLSVVQLFSDSIQETSTIWCELMGSAILFSFLSAFFWLTSMNFDLWWTFSGCRPLRASTKTGEKKRFLFFSLFSVGFPSAIAGTGLSLDYIFRYDTTTRVIRPRFGERNCYLFAHEEQLPYFYGPVGFLLCINCMFFLSTIYSLHKLQRDTKFATRQSSKQEKKRFVLFMKLFVVMGVLWIFEVISWATVVFRPEQSHIIKNFFITTDLLNALQGVAIFIIFTCKPNTCKLLEGQFKRVSVYLQEKRDKKDAPEIHSVMKSASHCFFIVFCTLLLPFVHGLRQLFSFCGRPTRSLEGRRTASHNLTTTSTFEKHFHPSSRKVSDCSASTTFSVVDHGNL